MKEAVVLILKVLLVKEVVALVVAIAIIIVTVFAIYKATRPVKTSKFMTFK